MELPTLLPNDFCCIWNANNAKQQEEQVDPVADPAKQRFFNPLYWVARVVKLTDNGTYRLNWFAEKPTEEGTFLKTDHYFYEEADAIVPFKNGLVSGEERDFYKTEKSSSVAQVLKEKSTLKGGHGPSKEDVEQVYTLFSQLTQDEQETVESVSSIPTQADEEEDEDDIVEDASEETPSAGDIGEIETTVAKRKFMEAPETDSSSMIKKQRSASNLLPISLDGDDENSHFSPHWTKLSPKVGSERQADVDIINQLYKIGENDKSREEAKASTKSHKVFSAGKGPALKESFSLVSEKRKAGDVTREWTSQEKALFEMGLYKHSELFYDVSKHIAENLKREENPTKDTFSCVEYFYDVFHTSRAFHIWHKQEIRRLEMAERQRREKERQKIKEQRRLRKKRLVSCGIDPKVHNYRGESVVKSEKICNALIKIKSVLDKERNDEIKSSAFNPVDPKQLNLVGEVNSLLPANTLSTLKGISDLSAMVESNVSQRKPKEARAENQFRNIQGLISASSSNAAAQISKQSLKANSAKPSTPEHGIAPNGLSQAVMSIPEALKNNLIQMGIDPMDPRQLSHLTQMLQQQQQSDGRPQLQRQGNRAQPPRVQTAQPPSQRSTGSGSSSPAQPTGNQPKRGSLNVQKQAAANVQNAQLQNLQNLQSIAQAQAQAQELMQRAQQQQQMQQGQAQAQGGNLNAVLQQMAPHMKNVSDAQGMQEQFSGNPSQLQLLQMLQMQQAKQQQEQATHINTYLQLQQLGQIPPNMTLEQYILLASQQEQFKQQLRQLHFLQQLTESQRQQQQQQQQFQQQQQQTDSSSQSQQGAFSSLPALQELQQRALLLQQQQRERLNQPQTVQQGQSQEGQNSQGQIGFSNSAAQGLEQSFQIEKAKLQMTHQQEAVVLRMRQMQEIRQAALQGQDTQTLHKKHEAEKKSLRQMQHERQMVLEHEYHQNLLLQQGDQRQHDTGQQGLSSMLSQFNAAARLNALQQLSQQQAGPGVRNQPTQSVANNQSAEQNTQIPPQFKRERAPQVQSPQNQSQARNSPQVQNNQQQQQELQNAWMLEQLKQAAANNSPGAAVNLQQLQALQNIQNLHLYQQQQQQQQINQSTPNNGTPTPQPSLQQLQQAQLEAQQKAQQQQPEVVGNNLLAQHMQAQRQLQAFNQLNQLNMLVAQQQQQQQQGVSPAQQMYSLQQLQSHPAFQQRQQGGNDGNTPSGHNNR